MNIMQNLNVIACSPFAALLIMAFLALRPPLKSLLLIPIQQVIMHFNHLTDLKIKHISQDVCYLEWWFDSYNV